MHSVTNISVFNKNDSTRSDQVGRPTYEWLLDCTMIELLYRCFFVYELEQPGNHCVFYLWMQTTHYVLDVWMRRAFEIRK